MSVDALAAGAATQTDLKRHRRRRLTRLVLLPLVLLVLVMVVGWLGWQAYQIDKNLHAARTELQRAKSELFNSGDLVRRNLEAAQHQSRAARSAARDPLWSMASRIPIVGRSFRAAAGIAEVSDRLTHATIPILAAASDDVRGVRAAASSALPLDTLAALAAPLAEADAQLKADSYSLAHLPHADVHAIANAQMELTRDVDQLERSVNTAAVGAKLGAPMLGADGPRHYFVAFENRAEMRPDGGNLSAYAVVLADHGHLHVVKFGPNTQLPVLARPPAAEDPAFIDAYGAFGAGRLWVNTNLSPDFPADAHAWAAMYTAATRTPIDGVIALDPVTLGALEQLTGQPIVVPGAGAIPPAQLADFLERREYDYGLPEAARKALLADIGHATLDRLVKTHVSARALLQSLGALAGTGHLRLASMDAAQEQDLLQFPIAGAVPRTTAPFAGAYVSNATGGKLDAYLHEAITYAAPSCGAPGTGTITVSLLNSPPAGPLPAFVTKRHDHPSPPVPPGENRVALTVVGTTGARWLDGTLDGRPIAGPGQSGLGSATQSYVAGHPAWTVFLELPRNATQTLRIKVAEPKPTGAHVMAHQSLIQPVDPTFAGGCSGQG